MVSPKYRAILWARAREALYRPLSSEIMVWRVTSSASASSAWLSFRAFLSSEIRLVKEQPPSC